MKKKILIIRFSSFGDVLQTLSVVGALQRDWPDAEIHWVTRQEFAPLLTEHPALQRVWTVERKTGFTELQKLAADLRRESFTHVYDAHNNLRSHILAHLLLGPLQWRRWLGKIRFLRRSIFRWKRFLLFRFRINRFPQPFSGQRALLEPLEKWGLSSQLPSAPQLFLPMVNVQVPFDDYVALAPSAAFPLKRWPLSEWRELIHQSPQTKFIVLGGKEDSFLHDLAKEFPSQVSDCVGKLSLLESAHVVSRARALVANDTGLMHVAEQSGRPCVALMGPAPFGFPSRPLTEILQVDLPCRPCSKHGQGPCVNPEFQKCLRAISVEQVRSSLNNALKRSGNYA